MRKATLNFLFLLSFSSLCFSSLLDVKYAGFAFTGNFKDIPINFKYTYSLLNSTKDINGLSIFDKELLDFFKENKSSIVNFNLLIGEESDTKISVALAVSRENVSIVNIEDIYKIVVNLCCNLIFMDFNEMKIISSYPLYLEYIDVKKEMPTEDYKLVLIKKLYFSEDFSILRLLKERLNNLKLKKDAKLSFKVMNVYVEDGVRDKLDIYKYNIEAFKSMIAQRFSNILSKKLNVSVLPYAKDYLGAKMSLVFSDARMQDFEIPPTSYGIDFTLRKVTKELYKKGIGEDAYIYGVYITIKVYDPDLDRQYWKKRIKYGIIKKIPKLQKNINDFSIYEEMIELVMLKAIKEMQKDKTFYKEVVERCLNR